MSEDSAFGRALRNVSDKLQDQVWFQQGKAKWDELDARSKTAVKYFLLVGTAAGIVGLVGSSLYSVAAQKSEIDEKLALIQKIQNAQDELRRLREITSQFNSGGDEPWGQFLQEKAAPAGIAADSVQIVSEAVVASGAAPAPAPKSPKGKSAKVAEKEKDREESAAGPEETVVEANLKKINVRQLAKYLHEIENGGRTVKIRRLAVDTQKDGSGYLDATVVVSAFRLKP